MSYGRPVPTLADVSFEPSAAYTRPAFNAADAEWVEPATVEIQCRVGTMLTAAPATVAEVWLQIDASTPTMLAAPAVLVAGADAIALVVGMLRPPMAVLANDIVASVAAPFILRPPKVVTANDTFATANVPSVLRAPKLRSFVDVIGFAGAPTPLGSAFAWAFHDFTNQLAPHSLTQYVMDLVTPGGLVRVPVSSWQATLQTEEQCYVQCVVPAATDWVATINAATEFIISRRGKLRNGDLYEHEMARAPAQTITVYPGTQNYTATLSGYSAAFPLQADPPAVFDRALRGVRTTASNSGTTRVRADVDWLLRPGQRAMLGDEAILVAFINYYAPGFDHYMDVGDRV